ncbi:MAG: S26 family signal peptidase [Pirellulaceae bacterium]
MSLLRLIPTAPLNRLRLSVVLLFLAVLAPALFRLWCIRGLIWTYRVDGPSMAETLCGTHFRVTCGDCGLTFRCDGDHFPDDRLAVCPNCGFKENKLRDEDLRRGDRVLVDTWPYLWSAPRRGDLVMLVEPKTSEGTTEKTYAVKRVAALPQERPGIRNGNLLVNGKVLAKSINDLRAVRSLVHDNDFLPGSLPASSPSSSPGKQRWLPNPPGASDWEAIPGGYRFTSSPERESDQWLAYEHWHASASPAPRTQLVAIQDNDPFNQADSRGLNPVRDLMLSCQVEGGSGDFMINLISPPHKFTVHLQLDSRRFLVRKDNTTILGGNLPESTRAFEFEVALCDGNLLIVRNRQVLATIAYDEMPPPANQQLASSDSSRLQIGAYGGPLKVTHLQVWRDIYYLNPNGLSGDWQAESPLAEGRYFLLGDNQPISVDSRQWGGGVAREEIVGRVIPLGR